MKRVVWTRPAEDWVQDQKILKPPHPVLHFPVTQQIEICPQLPGRPCDLIILTSRKAADAFFHKSGLSKDSLHKVEFVTFGLETYKYLLGLNLKARLVPASSGKKFAEILVTELKKGTVVWFPKPVETAFAISEYLRTHGIESFDIELYRTECIKTFDSPSLQRLVSEPSVVCFASPNALKAFVDIIRTQDEARFNRYPPVVIGPTTKAAGQTYFNELILANSSNLSSLWEKAVDVAKQEDLYNYAARR